MDETIRVLRPESSRDIDDFAVSTEKLGKTEKSQSKSIKRSKRKMSKREREERAGEDREEEEEVGKTFRV